MALINLKTDLKSLKYGRDTTDGGDSKLPLVKTLIPESFTEIGNTGGFDNLFRGGALIGTALVNDELRIGKLINTFRVPQGASFKTKLNLLSTVSVKTQASNGEKNQGTYNTVNTLKQIALNPIDGRTTLFNSQTYLEAVGRQQTFQSPVGNRLYTLYEGKITQRLKNTAQIEDIIQRSQLGATQQILEGQGFNLDLQSSQTLYSYKGGPGSGKAGEGKTIIPITNPTNRGSVNYLMTATAISNKELYFNQSTSLFRPFTLDIQTPNNPNINTNTYQQRPRVVGDPGRRSINRNLNTNKSYYTRSAGTNETNFSPLLYEKGNSFGEEAGQKLKAVEFKGLDFVTFKISIFENKIGGGKVSMYFPATVNGFSDSYTADWANHNVLGRGEKFYTYNGFTRQISFGFTVHAQSRPELLRQYQKLNYLVSSLSPDYSGGSGIMKGNFAEITYGDYIKNMPGIITSLTLALPDNSPWNITGDTRTNRDADTQDTDITTDPQLPHMIQVTGFNFIPLHTFIPEKVDTQYAKYMQAAPRDAESGIVKSDKDYISSRFVTLPEEGYSPGKTR